MDSDECDNKLGDGCENNSQTNTTIPHSESNNLDQDGELEIIWHDPNIDFGSREQLEIILKSLKINHKVAKFSSPEQTKNHIQMKFNLIFIVITCGRNGENLVKMLSGMANVKKVFVFCGDVNFHSIWANNYLIVGSVTNDFRDLLSDIKEELVDYALKLNQKCAKKSEEWRKEGEYEKAIENYDKILSINKLFVNNKRFIDLNNKEEYTKIIEGIAESNMEIGLIHKKRDENSAAIKRFQKFLDINEKYLNGMNNLKKSICYKNIGDCYAMNDIYDKRILENYFQALDILKNINRIEEFHDIIYEIKSLGMKYRDNDKYDLAITCFDKCCKVYSKYANQYEQWKLAKCHFYVGDCYKLNKKYGQALKNYAEAIEIFQKMGEISRPDINEIKQNAIYVINQIQEQAKNLQEEHHYRDFREENDYDAVCTGYDQIVNFINGQLELNSKSIDNNLESIRNKIIDISKEIHQKALNFYAQSDYTTAIQNRKIEAIILKEIYSIPYWKLENFTKIISNIISKLNDEGESLKKKEANHLIAIQNYQTIKMILMNFSNFTKVDINDVIKGILEIINDFRENKIPKENLEY